MSGPVSRVWKLTAITAGLWLLAALPAWLIAGMAGVEGLTYALLLCLIPGIVALGFIRAGESANQALAALLLGMGLRMAAVLAGIFALRQLRPDLGTSEFHIWIIIGYLVTLGVETKLMLADIAITRGRSEFGHPTI